ncbi:NAD-dependent deacylase [Corynebacterium camporealensis]
MTDSLALAQRILNDAQRIHIFSGAGMSAESGLDTYRDAQTGVWSHVDPQAMASIDAWARDPEPMWRWYKHRAKIAAAATPNAGHLAIANCSRTSVTTQNIDNLHEKAGSEDVIHLHGSLFEYRCSMCARPYKGDTDVPTPPACPLCGNLVRPGVVWFGEPLPQKEWAAAEEAMTLADAVIIVGTSGVVYPAAGLPMLASAPIIEVSPARTDLTHLTTAYIQGTAGTILPEILPE